jgi:GAF domain-containing protein
VTALVAKFLQDLVAVGDVRDLDLDSRIEDLLERARRATGAVGAALLLLDDSDALRLVSASNEPARMLEEAQIALQEGPAIQALRSGQIEAVADLRADPRYRALGETLQPAGVYAVLAAPLTVRGVPVGTLCLYRAQTRPWTAEHLDAAGQFATLLALLLRIAAEAGHGQIAAGQVQRKLHAHAVKHRPDHHTEGGLSGHADQP